MAVLKLKPVSKNPAIQKLAWKHSSAEDFLTNDVMQSRARGGGGMPTLVLYLENAPTEKLNVIG